MVSDFLHIIISVILSYSVFFRQIPSGPQKVTQSQCTAGQQLGAQLLCNALKFPSSVHALFAQSTAEQQSTELQAIRKGMHRSSAARCATTLQCTKIVQLYGYFTYLSITHCTALQCIEPKSTSRHILWFRRYFLLFGCAQIRNQDFMNYNRFFFS